MFWALALISLSFAAVPPAVKPVAAKGKAIPAKTASKTVAKAPAKAPPSKGPAKVSSSAKPAAKPGTRPSVAATAVRKPAVAPARGRVQPPQYSRYSNATSSRNRRQLATSRTTAVRPRPVYHPVQSTPTTERYKDIQSALVLKGYLGGEPTGTWDADSIAAMKRFQKDQSLEADGKLSSLSLIALGLGPKRTLTASAVPVPVPSTTIPVPPKP